MPRLRIKLTDHALKRMERYGLEKWEVVETIEKPDRVVVGHKGHKVAHRLLGRYVLRVVYEEDDFITVVTVYPSRSERYAEG